MDMCVMHGGRRAAAVAVVRSLPPSHASRTGGNLLSEPLAEDVGLVERLAREGERHPSVYVTVLCAASAVASLAVREQGQVSPNRRGDDMVAAASLRPGSRRGRI